jgi:hypothetical protein
MTTAKTNAGPTGNATGQPQPLRARFREALASDQAFEELRRVVVQLLDGGADRRLLIEALKQFRVDELRGPEHESQDDVVCDVLDLFHGWAAPGWRL